MSGVVTTSLPLALLHRGKVRDVYEVDAERLLLVATDRVSAFDVVCAEPVPHKGAVLTQVTAWWLGKLGEEIPHHMLAADARGIVEAVPALAGHEALLEGRAMLCRRTTVIPVECVVRGYMAGSAWKEYREHGTLAGEPLPAGLHDGSRFEPPIFSPATKATSGHDENITLHTMASVVGEAGAAELERLSRRIFEIGTGIAAERGLVLADTKFEFGRTADGVLLLIDEVLTPDSSRFWPAAATAGDSRPRASLDKQPLRDWLQGERDAGRWNGEAPAPPLPDEVVQAMSARYLDAFRLITGSDLPLPPPT